MRLASVKHLAGSMGTEPGRAASASEVLKHGSPEQAETRAIEPEITVANHIGARGRSSGRPPSDQKAVTERERHCVSEGVGLNRSLADAVVAVFGARVG